MFGDGAKSAGLLAALGGVMVGGGPVFGLGGAMNGLVSGLAMVGFSCRKSDTLATTRPARMVRRGEAQVPGHCATMVELIEAARMPMVWLNASSDLQPDDAFANPLTGRNVGFANLSRTLPAARERAARLWCQHV